MRCLFLSGLLACPAFASDWFQSSLDGPDVTSHLIWPHVNDRAVDWTKTPPQGLTLNGALSTTYEYNDNIARSTDHPVSDSIITSYLELDTTVPFSKHARLRLDGALGFNSYLDHPDAIQDGKSLNFLVAPGSTLSFESEMGPVRLRIYDTLGIQNAPGTAFTIQPNEIISYLNNEAGLDLQWAISKAWTLDFGYAHSDIRVRDDTIAGDSEDLFDRQDDVIRTTLAWSPTGKWSAGLMGSLGWHRYDSSFSNDALSGRAGLFVDAPLGKSVHLHAEAGYQAMRFDDPPPFTRTVTQALVNEAEAQLQSSINTTAELLGISAAELRAVLASVDLSALSDAANSGGASTASSAQIAALNAQIEVIRHDIVLAQLAGDFATEAKLQAQLKSLYAQANQLNATLAVAVTSIFSSAGLPFPIPSLEAAVALQSTLYLASAARNLRAVNEAEDAEYVSSNRDTSDLSDYYAQLTVRHQITPLLSHQVTIGHDSALNTTTNFLTSDFATYGVDFQPWKTGKLSLSAYYEWASESGGITEDEVIREELTGYVSYRQDYDQYGAALTFSQQLGDKMSASLTAQHTRVDSSGAVYSFQENAVHASLSCLLNRHTQLSVGYQFTTANTDSAGLDYDQHRVLCGVRLNF